MTLFEGREWKAQRHQDKKKNGLVIEMKRIIFT
jgi:hypothetical protein